MQCVEHPNATAAAYCSNCGSALCTDCVKTLDSRILCSACAAARVAPYPPLPSNPPTVPNAGPGRFPGPPPLPSVAYPYCTPGVSLLLGFIPGVGSICNGDYFKAFLQVLVFGSILSLASSDESGDLGPAFGFLTAAVYLYMPFEAYHVAKKRTLALQGITVLTPFEKIRFPELWVGSLAIVAGTVFLVNQFVSGTLSFVLRGWPLILIGIGIYNLKRYFRS